MKKLLKNSLKTVIFHGLFPMIYRWNARKPVRKKKVLFIEIRYAELTNNFQLLWDALRQREDVTVDVVFLGNSVYPYRKYLCCCMDMLQQLAQAEYVLVDESSNVLAALPIRPETKMVQVWHGCGAFKRFGHGVEGGLHEKYYNAYSLVTASSPEVVDIYAKSMGQKKETVLPIGVSRTDVFFSQDYVESSRQSIREQYGITPEQKVILYAPTFRGNVQAAVAPRIFDIGKMNSALGDAFVILYKGHPSVKSDLHIEEEHQKFFVDACEESIERLMCAADLCITDYSSLVFEYALLERPMFFYAYDYKEYVTERGFYYNYEEFVPGPICYTEDELIQRIQESDMDFDSVSVLENAVVNREQMRQQVRAFKEKFMSACDGKSTQRIIDHMFNEGWTV